MLLKTVQLLALVTVITLSSFAAATEPEEIVPAHNVDPRIRCTIYLQRPGEETHIPRVISVDPKDGTIVAWQPGLTNSLNIIANPALGLTLPFIDKFTNHNDAVLIPGGGTNGDDRLFQLRRKALDDGRQDFFIFDVNPQTGKLTQTNMPGKAASIMQMRSPTTRKNVLYVLNLENEVLAYDPITLQKLPRIAKIDKVGITGQFKKQYHRWIQPFDDNHILYHVIYGEYRLIDLVTGKTVLQANDWKDWTKVMRATYPDRFYFDHADDIHVAYFYGPNVEEKIWQIGTQYTIGLNIFPMNADNSVVLVDKPIMYGLEDYQRASEHLPIIPKPYDPITGRLPSGPWIHEIILKDLVTGTELKTRITWEPEVVLAYPDEIGADGRPGRVWVAGSYGQRMWIDFPGVGRRL